LFPVYVYSRVKFRSLILKAWLEHHKNLHHEFLNFLNEIRINYELFKKFIIMGVKIHNKFVPQSEKSNFFLCVMSWFNILKCLTKIMKKFNLYITVLDHAYIICSKIRRILNYKVKMCISKCKVTLQTYSKQQRYKRKERKQHTNIVYLVRSK